MVRSADHSAEHSADHFADHFSGLAARYAAYRPHYPPQLVDVLADRCARHDVAWDVGCGSGQLSVALARRFERVIATDPAQAQLDHAEADPRVEYRCAPAEASGLPDARAELAVAAQAAHWFDWPRFVAEAGRVVRPGGLVALVSYKSVELPGTLGEGLAAYYRDIEPYWPAGRAHVDNGYRDLVLPWPEVAAPPVAMTARWTRDELVGYITTWSSTARYVAAHGEGRLDELRRTLAARWPGGEPREVAWPLVVKLARRP
ncbi:MAG TPA: class I SAM-dependent methyltransferase [Kofleriaceae bacterium]|nr:class I SAM-dependent methyltransferase [Kofleriaceae bacterium]